MLPTNNGTTQLKKFWERPEGTTGMIFMALLIVGGGFLLYYMLPFIITLLTNTLHAMLLLGAVALILFLVTNKRVQTLAWYFFKMTMRKLTGALIMIDPIAITKSYISDLKKRLVDLNKQKGDLNGQIQQLRDTINSNKSLADQNFKKMDVIRKNGSADDQKDRMAATLAARKAGRLKKSNMKYKDLLVKMEKLKSVLDKMAYSCDIFIQDLEDEVTHQEKEYSIVKKSHSVLKSAMNILNAGDDKAEIFRQSLEFMADDVSMRVGQMEEFMDASQDFIHNIDIENGVFMEDGMQLLDAWEEKGIDTIFGQDVTEENAVKVDTRSTAAKNLESNAYGQFFN